ncbi:YiiX family permuted papain-like enzyme [Williamwhitmania taraxaci]|uniref:Permuted papain-like amidase enzyme, YaeF/YiiX, C92 family n=1 Tax=Williamwhitmania taraxaci TaxID=1640674 RepID=A0A1G6NKQ9_9BACT|nr:YiiX family permuted papain-like enzyme [Williamwhitmania taraxaci]SDC68231.1 Permuted papain-like amidase enzyme, YaeF/YiiX, C92 family [Williamwhitmania taraxaci]
MHLKKWHNFDRNAWHNLNRNGWHNFDRFIYFILSKELRNGDIIFQTSKSRQSKAIQLATGSKYSHMGIVYNENGKLYVYEAVQPVKLTPFEEWVNRGERRHFVVKRLKDAESVLDSETLRKMKKVGEKYNGKNYDIYFEWSDEKIYCSELVWKIYKETTGIEIGKLQHLSDFNLSNEVVRKIMKERYGEKIPLDENVISPVSMFESDKLTTIIDK